MGKITYGKLLPALLLATSYPSFARSGLKTIFSSHNLVYLQSPEDQRFLEKMWHRQEIILYCYLNNLLGR